MATKPTTKVYNNSLQIHGLPNKITLQPGKDVNGVRVPGLNYVDSAAWEEAKEHAQVRVLIDEKIVTEEVIPEAAPAAAPVETDPAAGAGTPPANTPPAA